jgi:MipA family protein
MTQQENKMRIVAALLATAFASAAATVASAQSASKAPESPWSVILGVGVASASEYEGASKRATSPIPIFDVSYRTKQFGTIGFGSRSRGLSWTAIDTDDYSIGISLSGSTGRVDNKDGSLLRPGSKRLRGMGEIKGGVEYGVFGHVTVGVPIMLSLTKGSGDGKANVKDFSVRGHGGTQATLSTEIPWKVSDALTLSLSPSLNWVDKKYTQTYFGVTAAQAARTHFKPLNAKGGIKSYGVNVGASYRITSNWSADANVGYEQLQGDAGKSPLTQKKGQTSANLGIAYKF